MSVNDNYNLPHLNTYPEMNKEIVNILRLGIDKNNEQESIHDIYAAQLIEELTATLNTMHERIHFQDWAGADAAFHEWERG